MNTNLFKFDDRTPAEVRGLLTSLNASRRRVRIFYGDAETGRAWMDEYGMTGEIGKSTGSQPIPLMIASARSMGGPGLLDGCIVKIVDIASRRTLYEHPNFSNPADKIALFVCDEVPGYICQARDEKNEVHANFKSWAPARNWLAFMRGTRFSK